MLTPLMKPEYQNGAPQLQQELLDIVVLRDNIGEGFWYLYTAILLTSIVQYKLNVKGCTTDIATMEANREKYLVEQSKANAKIDKLSSTVYTA